WTFATADQSYIPVELSQCLPIDDGVDRLACYDELARRPTKGAKVPSRTYGEAQRGRNHSNVPSLDRVARLYAPFGQGINDTPHRSIAWTAGRRRLLAGP